MASVTKVRTKITADQDIVNGKVPIFEKISYSLGELGQNVLMMFGATFASAYFILVVGLDEIVVGSLLIATKLLDALTDVAMGYLFERRSPGFAKNWKNGGRWRGWLLLMMPLGLISYLMLFNFPLGSSLTVLYIFYIAAQVLQGIGMSGTNMAHENIMPRMTQNPKERNMIGMMRGLCVVVATMVVQMVVPMLLPASNPESPRYLAPGTAEYITASQSGYTTGIILCGAIFVITTVMAILFSKERLNKQVEKLEATHDKRKFIDSIKILAKNKAMMVMVIVGLLTTTANTLVSATQFFWFSIYMGNLQMMGLITIISGNIMMLAVLITPFIANKIGKKNTYLLGLIIMGLMSAVRIFIPQGDTTMLLFIMAPSGIGTGLFLSLAGSLGSDSAEYSEWKSGKRVDGIMGSVNYFINKGFGLIVPSIPLFVLGLTGFDSTLAVQPDSAMFGINLTFSILPTIFYALSAICFAVMYPLNKQTLEQMLAELKERRMKEAQENN